METAAPSQVSASQRRRERERRALTERMLDAARDLFVRGLAHYIAQPTWRLLHFWK